MPYYDHERFQIHCRFCQRKFEGDSIHEALSLVEAHEAECAKRGARP